MKRFLEGVAPAVLIGILIAAVCNADDARPDVSGEIVVQDNYQQMAKLAIRQDKVLIVFVRQAVFPVPGCLVCRDDEYGRKPSQDGFPGLDSRGAFVSIVEPASGFLYERKRLVGKPTASKIAEHIPIRGESRTRSEPKEAWTVRSWTNDQPYQHYPYGSPGGEWRRP